MAGKGGKKGSRGGVIIKKYEINEAGHHGGAWKVAYADFVTAMMAFFLLMWLLNATTGISAKASPTTSVRLTCCRTRPRARGIRLVATPRSMRARSCPTVARFRRSSAGPRCPIRPRKERTPSPPRTTAPARVTASDRDQWPRIRTRTTRSRRHPWVRPAHVVLPGQADRPIRGPRVGAKVNRDAVTADSGAEQFPGQSTESAEAAEQALRVQQARQEKASFRQAAEQITQAVQADPALAELSKQLAIDMTPDGLRIQIMDEVKLPMFPSGSATPNERVRLLMQKVVPVLMRLSQPISIAGHTDATAISGS